MTPTDRLRHQQRVAAAKKASESERLERQSEAAKQAGILFSSGKPATSDHPYLRLKKVQAHDLRVAPDGKLLIPMFSGASDEFGFSPIVNIQTIAADGTKLYQKSALKSGAQHMFKGKDDLIYITEGWATGATVHEATGATVVVAFDRAGLKPVALIQRARNPNAHIIIAGDNDQSGDGQIDAKAAALACGGIALISPTPTDWNDHAAAHGLEAVRVALNEPSHASSQEAWPEPGPIHAPLHAVEEFRPDLLLPEALRDWVMDEADRMPVASDFIAAGAIVALGATIGARCAVKPKSWDGWLVVPNLWGGVVGDPSAKKSPAIAAAMKPLDRLTAETIKKHQQKMKEHNSSEIIFEARKSALEKRLKIEAAKESKNDE